MRRTIQRPTVKRPAITSGTIRLGFCLAVTVVGASAMPFGPAAAQERLLRCMTSIGPARPGHRPQHFAQRHLYAPARNAMFFSRTEATCRWKTARDRHS